MDIKKQLDHIDQFTNKMKLLISSKGDDYAGTDRLLNFKVAGNICNISPEINCLSLIATKVARLGNLLQNNVDPQNESIRDSIIDLANYAALLDMLVSENTKSNIIEVTKHKKNIK